MDIQQLLTFLQQLQENNNKSWMNMHKAAYQQARHTLITATDSLIKGLGEFDPDIAQLTPQHCIFRINRDIRFSKDKTPYKTNMGTYLAKGGRHGGYAGYYLHIEPARSFIGGGLYQPESAVLQRIRQEIDYNADTLYHILAAPLFKKLFGELRGEKLQRPPQGYQTDHPQIELFKFKSLTVMHHVKDSTLVRANFLNYTLEVFQAMLPLNQFFNAAIDD